MDCANGARRLALVLALAACHPADGGAGKAILDDGEPCDGWPVCRSGVCLDGLCGLPGAAAPPEACGGPGESCVAPSDCCAPSACVDRVCRTAPPEGAGPAGALDCPAVDVGARCLSAADCGEGAVCLRNIQHLQFPGGYCSVDAARRPGCCPEGSAPVSLGRLPLRPCIEVCSSDAQCRTEDGFLCALGVCFPPPHEGAACEDAEGAEGADPAADTGDEACVEHLDGPEDSDLACADAYDNDADGLLDCEDADCAASGACNGLAVSDPCAGVEAAAAPGGHVHGCDEVVGEGGGDVASCAGRGDDDGDGRIDCLDDECAFADNCRGLRAGHGEHGGGGGGQAPDERDERVGEGGEVATCEDGRDNDDDGATDCADIECGSAPHCDDTTADVRYGEGPRTEPVTCVDGRDNDRDGATDCDDDDCAGFMECVR